MHNVTVIYEAQLVRHLVRHLKKKKYNIGNWFKLKVTCKETQNCLF